MESYIQPLQIRWSDLDPNFHVRHSAYYDYGASLRISYLNEQGLTPSFMAQFHLGPILFREECVFRKELRFGEILQINLELIKSSESFSRWSIRHHILKTDNVLAAVITVDGAWIDTNRRKLTTPPGQVADVFNQMPRAKDFTWVK